MVDMPKVNEFCWSELATHDVQAAKDFYGKMFGWQFTDNDLGDMTYTMISANNKTFGGIWAIPKDKEKMIPPHWLSYILVENLEDSVIKATQHGAKIIRPPMKAGAHGCLAILTDPTGAHIALWENQ